MPKTARSPLRTAALAGGTALAFAFGLAPGDAEACGCFAPPDPSVPLVQAGERILFSQQDGEVIAHIQIQYSGKPGEFGWLLPLPAVPKDKTGKDGIDIGVDELFTQLISATQPKYRLRRVYESCGGGGLGSPRSSAEAADGGFGGNAPAPQGPNSPLVVQDTVGPYRFAVLRADNRDEMFKWLADNRYFVPAGTEAASAPYIRPGAYFLALKLKAGQSAGDLQPVVLRYKSDLPMIPIVLTSVGANPNMGIQVWMLGRGRAIPRNYYHTVINDSQINWFTAGQNYNDVIIKAVGESPEKHSFVTEYAGTSGVMNGRLDAPGRFDDLARLSRTNDPVAFVRGVLNDGFTLNGQLTSLLSRTIPVPQSVAARGITPAQYYQNIEGLFVPGSAPEFDAAVVADELRVRIAEPTREAAALLTSRPYLTRLYTTLSPEDMDKDPVFSYNPSLPDYKHEHEATLTYHCSAFFGNGRYSSATLVTESGWRIGYSVEDADRNVFSPQALPFSQRIETLSEVGPPNVLVDNSPMIRGTLGGAGCSTGRGSTGAGAVLLCGAAGLLALIRKRRGRV
jgi:hypothetical protein